MTSSTRSLAWIVGAAAAVVTITGCVQPQDGGLHSDPIPPSRTSPDDTSVRVPIDRPPRQILQARGGSTPAGGSGMPESDDVSSLCPSGASE
jgi:hypothetical protein